jgi:hypothetical protein
MNNLNSFKIISLVETWLIDPLNISPWPNHNLIFSNATKHSYTGRGSGGLLLGLDKTLKFETLDIHSNWIIVKINNSLDSKPIIICTAYIPPGPCNDHILPKLFKTIDSFFFSYRQFLQKHMLML